MDSPLTHEDARMHSQGTQTLWETNRAQPKPEGGFVQITVPELLMAYSAYQERHISLKALHLWFAGHELVKTRLNLEDWQSPNFSSKEFKRLIGGTDRAMRRAFRELRAVGLMTCSESSIELATSPDQLRIDELSTFWAMLNAVPKSRRDKKLKIPRRLLLLAAGGARKGLVATLIAQFIWCLFNKQIDGEYQILPTGNCKSSWIAKTFGLTTRAVEEQRRHLVNLGVLIPEDQEQWHLNRYGRRYSVNLRWNRPDKAVDNSKIDAVEDAVGEGGDTQECRQSSTPSPEIGAKSSTPLNQHLLSSRELNNQHPSSARPAGIKNSFSEEKKPFIKRLVKSDLNQTSRLLELYEQTVRQGGFRSNEHERMLFVSAAEHARVIGTENPCGLFASMIRNRNDRKWAYITQGDEDAAISRIKAYFRPETEREPVTRPERNLTKPELSDDAKLVRAAQKIAADKGIRNAFRLIKPHHPQWTQERYDTALSELEDTRFQRSMAPSGDGRSSSEMSRANEVLAGCEW